MYCLITFKTFNIQKNKINFFVFLYILYLHKLIDCLQLVKSVFLKIKIKPYSSFQKKY